MPATIINLLYRYRNKYCHIFHRWDIHHKVRPSNQDSRCILLHTPRQIFHILHHGFHKQNHFFWLYCSFYYSNKICYELCTPESEFLWKVCLVTSEPMSLFLSLLYCTRYAFTNTIDCIDTCKGKNSYVYSTAFTFCCMSCHLFPLFKAGSQLFENCYSIDAYNVSTPLPSHYYWIYSWVCDLKISPKLSVK